MIDLGGGSQPPQRHPKEPHPIPALPFNVALLKGASLGGVDSAQIRRQEPEVYARLTNDIASWLGNGRAPAPRASMLVWVLFGVQFCAPIDRIGIRDSKARGFDRGEH